MISARIHRGFTLLEVMVAAAILAIAIVGLLSVLTATQRLQQQTRESTLALNAIRDKLEELRNYPNFNDTSSANPCLVDYYTQTGTNPRTGMNYNQFGVPGLNPDRPWASTDDLDSDGFRDLAEPGDSEQDAVVGFIDFFIDESQSDEDATRVGLPMDLDGDGATTTTNTNTDGNGDGFKDYNLVPVTVRVEWRSGNNSSFMQVSTALSRRR
jgi:prepilin-type N-terminal cleavage/methylation domain-containing protein